MNKGTFEGTEEEKNLVCKINKGYYDSFLNQYFATKKLIYCSRVTKNKFSKLSDTKVPPKSDIFLIRTKICIDYFLKEKDFYLNEEDLDYLKKNEHSIEYIQNSGISIKRKDSKNYQIHKFTPISFYKLFKDNFIGAGAMIYQKNERDFSKNKHIIESNWKIPEEKFYNFFKKKLDNSDLKKNDKNSLQLISSFCLKEIKSIINNSEAIKTSIFTGKNDFEEPFGASFSFINGSLKEYEFTDFYVTQGSGRVNHPTIVIKPR